jgi:hypothetical protein
MIFKAGDILLTHNPKLLGKLIRFFESRPGDKAEYNHTAIIVKEGDERSSELVEAMWKTHQILLWDGYGTPHKDSIAVYRPLNIPPDKISLIVEKAKSYIGDQYGWWKLLLHAADWQLFASTGKDLYFFRRLAFIDKYPICSWVVANAYSRAGYDFGVPPNEASPHDIQDFVETHPEKYELVFGPGRLG